MIEGGLDIALLVVLGYFFLRGAFRGVVKEVVAVLGLFVAFWVASVYWPLGVEHLRTIFDMPGQRGITSFIVIFLVVYFLIGIISTFADKIVRITISPVLSSLLGAVVGLIKGVLICGILLAGAENFLRTGDKFLDSSQIWPYLKPVTEQAKAWMPEGLRNILASSTSTNTATRDNLDNGNMASLPPVAIDSADWNTIQNLLVTRADDISEGWKDKIRNISGGEAWTAADQKRFINEHPNIFFIQVSDESADTKPPWPTPAE